MSIPPNKDGSRKNIKNSQFNENRQIQSLIKSEDEKGIYHDRTPFRSSTSSRVNESSNKDTKSTSSVQSLDEFVQKRANLVRSSNKDVVTNVMSSLNHAHSECDEGIYKLDDLIEKMAKVSIVYPDFIKKGEASKLILKKEDLEKVKYYITKNKNVMNGLNVDIKEINCPTLIDEKKDPYSIAINELTRMIFKREVLNKKISEKEEAKIAFNELTKDLKTSLAIGSDEMNPKVDTTELKAEIKELKGKIKSRFKKICMHNLDSEFLLKIFLFTPDDI